MIIREFKISDLDQLWEIFRSVVKNGDAYDFAPNSSREEADSYFTDKANKVFVAEIDSKIAGVYLFRTNRRGLGNHVGNCSYMVSEKFRGNGVGFALGKHSINYAAQQGFKAIQFNFVVSTNTAAVNLWKKLGFEIIGTIPGGYNHSNLGFVDAYIMFRKL